MRTVKLQGRQVGARGPPQIPPSWQGQPVIFMPSASGWGLQAVGMYANASIAITTRINARRAQRDQIHSLAEAAAQTFDEVKVLAFMTFSSGPTSAGACEAKDCPGAGSRHISFPSFVSISAARSTFPMHRSHALSNGSDFHRVRARHPL